MSKSKKEERKQEEHPEMEKPQAGDLVRLKHGGPVMTLGWQGEASCHKVYYDRDGSIGVAEVPLVCLVKVYEEEGVE